MKKNQIINLHEPSFNNIEKKYLYECIKSGYVSSVGKYVNIFEYSRFLDTFSIQPSLLGKNPTT